MTNSLATNNNSQISQPAVFDAVEINRNNPNADKLLNFFHDQDPSLETLLEEKRHEDHQLAETLKHCFDTCLEQGYAFDS